MSSNATDNPVQSHRPDRHGYIYPPGLKHNLLWQAARKFRPANPILLFSHLAQVYGDIAHYKLGPKHIIFLNHPEYIREVMVVQHSNFVKERTQRRAKLLLGAGMITADGQTHRKQRQVAQPSFHRQRVPAYAQVVIERAMSAQDQWQDGSEVNIYREMMHFALGTVARTLFSTELGAEVVDLNKSMSDIMDVYQAIVLLPGIRTLLKIPGTPLRKFIYARDRFDKMVYRLIEEHRRDGDRGDLLSGMLEAQQSMGWTDSEIRDQVLTIFLAGYETVAIALTWTWYLLSQNPECQARFHSELDGVLGGRLPTYEDIPRLRYVEIVLSESMRLYPPAWAMGREAIADFELGPYRLPAGTTVLMSQFISHRDSRFYPDPLRFDPERFTPEAKAARPRFTYFPFGMGPRQCIGEAFAWMEGVLTLATIGQNWRMELIPGQQIDPQPLFTLRPKRGISMRVHAR
jgi:cytochrome P450